LRKAGDSRGGGRCRNGRHGLQAALEVVGEQLAEAGVAEGLAVGALHEVEIRSLVALDQAGAVVEDRDVPADDDMVRERRRAGASGAAERGQDSMKILETQRLILRHLVPDDLDSLFALEPRASSVRPQ